MVGYSDSGKDTGRLSAVWEQYGVKLTMFHGRGGTVRRGGGPTHCAILSEPPDTINGSLRVTVQGEVTEQSFGEEQLYFRTFECFTSCYSYARNDSYSFTKTRVECFSRWNGDCCNWGILICRFVDYFRLVSIPFTSIKNSEFLCVLGTSNRLVWFVGYTRAGVWTYEHWKQNSKLNLLMRIWLKH